MICHNIPMIMRDRSFLRLGQFHPTDAWKNNEVARSVCGDLEQMIFTSSAAADGLGCCARNDGAAQ